MAASMVSKLLKTSCDFVKINSVKKLNRSAVYEFLQNRQYCTSSDEEPKLVHPDMPDPNLGNPYEPERLRCVLCKHNIQLDYKNTKLLSQFVSPYTGIVYQKHITGLCDMQQKAVEMAVRRSRGAMLMPSEHKDVRFLKDPKLFNPFHPTRPHPH